MYKVLLVDDEPWVLLGLENSIEWHELNLKIPFHTTDSSAALDIILSKQPDIVITDIQMPNVSGLDLMRCAREQGINCSFIVFSGYSDFEYAKQAIQYGVFAYLLKPLNPKELTKTLSLLTENINSQKYIMREQEESLFLDGHIKIDAAPFENCNGPFCILTCYITFSDKILLDSLLSEVLYSSSRLGSNKYIYLLNAGKNNVKSLLTEFLKSELCAEKEYISFGISNLFFNKSEIKAALQESNIAAHNHFLYSERYVNEFTPTNIGCCNLFLTEFYKAVETRDSELIETLLEEKLAEHCIENELNIQDFSYIYNCILTYLEKTLCKCGETEYEALSYDSVSSKYTSVSDAVHFLRLVAKDAQANNPMPENSEKLSEAFDQILNYINKNYNREISLSDLANRFYINMTYICDLFKKNLSTTFSKYLTNLRLEKAYKMICTTDKTLSEITEIVGYRDYYYFIKQFKKKYIITPGQLRKEKTAHESQA